MTDNELLLALSGMMDGKSEPIKSDIRKINITLENDILPRLQNLESCYTSTYNRYASGVENIESMQADIEILKKLSQKQYKKLLKKFHPDNSTGSTEAATAMKTYGVTYSLSDKR